MSLSVCMIVKNEEKYLSDCLNSIMELADELIVVDTGSNDQTLSIAERYRAQTRQITWTNNFAVARNYALNMASGDWILVIDADERLPQKFHPKIRNLLKKGLEIDVEGIVIQIKNYYGNRKGEDYVIDSACRLFRNRSQYRYESPLHEEMSEIIRQYKPQAKILKTDFYLEHIGYLNQIIKEKKKNERNCHILEKALMETPADPFLLYAYGTELFQQNNYQDALECYEKITANLAELSFGADLLYKTVIALLEQEEYFQGISLIEKGLEFFSDFQALWFVKGEYHIRCDEFKEAVAAYQRCLELSNDNSKYLKINGLDSFRTYHALARVYEKMGEDNKAASYYLQALEGNPGSQMVLNDLKGILVKMKKKIATYLDLSRVTEKYDPIYKQYGEWLMGGDLVDKAK